MSCWKVIEGKSYYFDADGVMYTDMITVGCKRVGTDGAQIDYEPGYVDAVNNNRYRERLYLSNEYRGHAVSLYDYVTKENTVVGTQQGQA